MACLIMSLSGAAAFFGCDDGTEESKDTKENTQVLCTDGEDNDNNGKKDCEDSACKPFCNTEWEFSEWPEGKSPEEIGKLLAENFVQRSLGSGEMHYAQPCAWYGALDVAALIEDDDLLERLIQRFDPLLTEEGADLVPSGDDGVDDRVFGIAPLEIFRHTDDDRYSDMGLAMADAQWENPRPDGLTRDARYWIDDMYMITALQVQAYRVTDEDKYRERAALTMAAYLNRLQQDTGLFFHTTSSPVYWGRGNGWVAAGMAEMLRSLPEDNEYYEVIMAGYTAMMAALLEYQTDDGIWRQIIDDEEAWLETSGSAMFTFAMATGVKNGWLGGEVYGPAVEKAWRELVTYLDARGNISDVCEGTGAANYEVGSDPEDQRQYYLDRRRNRGDLHGQAPMLWTAAALLR